MLERAQFYRVDDDAKKFAREARLESVPAFERLRGVLAALRSARRRSGYASVARLASPLRRRSRCDGTLRPGL